MKHLFLILILGQLSGAVAAGDGWPQFLGPHRNGTVAAPAALFQKAPVLTKLWDVSLGSGYSGVLVANGRLYTQFQEGDHDVVACWDAATGKRLWTHAYAPAFPAVGSSKPGPLSTPVLDGEHLYNMGARGELMCLRLADGKPVWTRDLVGELAFTPPELGMISSPLLDGDLLYLLAAGSDKGLVAFDKKTGGMVRHMGGGRMNSNSPSLFTLLGRPQLVAAMGNTVFGFDPTTGATLWQGDHHEGSHILALDDSRLLIDSNQNFVLYRLEDTRAGNISMLGDLTQMGAPAADYRLKELWRTNYLSMEYDLPVFYQGRLYGFKNGIFNCLDAATGKKLWSSRDTGPGMVTLVGNQLVVLGYDGVLTIAPASPEGFETSATLQVFENSGLTTPSYDDGVIYLRSYSRLAAVRVSASAD